MLPPAITSHLRMRRRLNAGKSPSPKLTAENYDLSKQGGGGGEEIKSQKSNIFSSSKNIFAMCLAFRIANSLLIQTYFNPDEHWQALEVAHCIVFGYGHLTWEWKKGIRGYLHPLVFALLFKILAVLGLDTPWFMTKAPRMLQALFSAVGDLYLYKLSYALFNYSVANWAVSFYYESRGLVLGLSCLLDRLMYGSWVIVPLNFLKFNFLSSGGDYYGTHKWHWYFSQGFSVMLFTFLPFAIAGSIKSKCWKHSGLIAWVIVLYSLLGHKEFRFVLPVLPIALIFSGYALSVMARPDSPRVMRKGSSNSYTKWPSKVAFAVIFLLATNIPMAFYMSLVHQRGTEDVMIYLSKEASNEKVKSILFLMPCHATPYFSTLHHHLPMRFLDCTPSEEKGIPDESDRFMLDPVGFASELAKNWSLPSHVVLFESKERLLKDFLISRSFKEIRRFFHSHFKVDRDLQASVVVHALND
ncbi:mannosyltransferase APTG1 isoform X3 [Hevea brasiliensis]|uniref:mannosyltransferase APTG1 isoform X3 n=1 Tax=Hevea brasiliensis TaxID=3981 RepID=UPI0025DADD28|nr:mannosyltransferase APTG1 isoform X3 [Hevea brasiliensis]